MKKFHALFTNVDIPPFGHRLAPRPTLIAGRFNRSHGAARSSPEGKSYEPVWRTAEIKLMKNVLRAGLDNLRSRL